MLIALNILIFIASVFLLGFSSKWLVGALSRIALFLKIKEFVVACFVMAFATTLPNLAVGILSAVKNIPQLSFGDIIGGNIVDLSLILGLAALISRKGISSKSRTVQNSSIYTIFIAILPLVLIFDGNLSRTDGIVLLLSFIVYAVWLFSKKERFTKTYADMGETLSLKDFMKDLLLLFLGLAALLLSAEGVVKAASFFSSTFNMPLALVGLLIVGLGNCLPETVFSLKAATHEENWMVLGNLMGSVIMCATLVMGVVALIHPIQIPDFSPFAVARIFMIISILSFLISIRTGQKITKKEGVFLVGVYVIYLLAEIFIRYIKIG
ncbi:MAG: sodium:calcium antiporter [Candidatus Paceibacterota bacterium]